MSDNPHRRLSEPRLVALRAAAVDWPRGFLSGAATIPAGWCALVLGAGGQRERVVAGEAPTIDTTGDLVLLRTSPVECLVELREGVSADGHEVHAVGAITLELPQDASDMAAFAQALLRTGELDDAGLALAVRTAGANQALRDVIRANSAGALVHDDQRDAWRAALDEALKRFSFETGLRLGRVVRLTINSASLSQQQRLEQETHQRVARLQAHAQVEAAAVAATHRRLDDLAGLLEKLKSVSVGDDELEWHRLLPALAPAERTQLLANLWRLTPDQTVAEAIVAVAGQECLWLSPASPEAVRRRLPLPEELGRLRSAIFAPSADALLIGAASGVWVVPLAEDGAPRAYPVPDQRTPRTGFNSAAIVGEWLIATHSEHGCWRWRLDEAGEAHQVNLPLPARPRTVRAATALDETRALVAADDTVFVVTVADGSVTGLPPLAGTVQTLTRLGDDLFVGTSDGVVWRGGWQAPVKWRWLHATGAPLESIAARQWADLLELVIPGGPAGAQSVYIDQDTVTGLLSAPQTIRRVWATDDLVVALGDARDRLFILNSASTGRDHAEAPISRWTGHSIQDACIVWRPAAPPPPNDTAEPTQETA